MSWQPHGLVRKCRLPLELENHKGSATLFKSLSDALVVFSLTMAIQKDKVIPMVEKLAKFRGFESLPDKIHALDAEYARNAESEARRAKEKKEKEFKDAVDAAVSEISASYQRFYLPEDSSESRRLKVYTASEKSLGELPCSPSARRNYLLPCLYLRLLYGVSILTTPA